MAHAAQVDLSAPIRPPFVPEGDWQAVLSAIYTGRAIGSRRPGTIVEHRRYTATRLEEEGAVYSLELVRFCDNPQEHPGYPCDHAPGDDEEELVDEADVAKARAGAPQPLNRLELLRGVCPRCHAPESSRCLPWCTEALHGHLDWSSSDCDGSYSGERILPRRAGENSHEYLQRVVSELVSVYAVRGRLEVSELPQTDHEGREIESGGYTGVEPVRVYTWQETTEEGHEFREIRTCLDRSCDGWQEQ